MQSGAVILPYCKSSVSDREKVHSNIDIGLGQVSNMKKRGDLWYDLLLDLRTDDRE